MAVVGHTEWLIRENESPPPAACNVVNRVGVAEGGYLKSVYSRYFQLPFNGPYLSS